MKTISRNAAAAAVSIAAWLTTLFLGSPHALATQRGVTPEERDHHVPRAGYLRTVRLLALRRNVSIRVAPGAPGQVTSLSGRRQIPTILIEFNNKSGQFPSGTYQDHLFGNLGSSPPQKTVSQYYLDMSLGQFEVTGRVIGWFRLPNDDTYYEEGNNGYGPGFGEFLTFGLDRADAIVDFGEFDNDGPDGLPNSGDDDGVVDTVFFVHPEAGAECQTFDELNNIWSHSWHYSEEQYGHTAAYETNDVQLNSQQVPVLNDDGTEKRIVVEDYTVQPGLACPTPSAIPKIVPIGVYAHEYGHALGLPDLYDRTPSGNVDSFGIGDWGVMSGGSWGFGNRPDTPTRMSAWSLARLGWANVEILDLSAPISLTLEPVQVRNRVYALDVAGSNGLEYFLVELKDPAWADNTGLRLNWDVDLPEAGLAIWHIDDNVGSDSPDWPFADPGKGQNDHPSLPNAPKHSLVSLEQADCRLHLERKNNGGDSDDLWASGSVFGVSNCNAGSISYAGTATGITIYNINLSQLTADIRRQVSPAPPSSPALVDADFADDVEEMEDTEEDSPAIAAAPAVRTAIASAPLYQASRPEYNAVVEHATATQLQRQASLDEVNAALASEQSIDALSVEQRAVLLGASTADIEYGVEQERQKEVKAWVAQQRQYQIQADFEPTTALQGHLKDLWQASGSDTPIQAQFDPSATRVDRVTGLSLPSGHETLAADAEERRDTTLQPLLGDNVQLQKVANEPDANAQQFQQVVDYDGEELPVFSKGVSLHYDENKRLKAIAAQTVDANELVVSGTVGALDWPTATEVVIRQTGLPASQAQRLEDAGEGIFLLDQDPALARVVRRMFLPGSGLQPDIVIYVDEETLAVVGIE